MDAQGLAMSKRFGQNFLINPHAREEILALLQPEAGQVLWEVGPGLGALTHHLVGKVALLKVFEIDRGFIRILQTLYGHRPDFMMVEGDALKTARAHWNPGVPEGQPARIFGNLPYNAASSFIMDCLEGERRVPMVYTVQKEAAARMAAPAGDSQYSSFSVQCQARFRVEIATTLGPSLFWPAPEVQSAVVTMSPRNDVGLPRRYFGGLVRSAFLSRRKTLLNNLKASSLWQEPGAQALLDGARDCGIELSLRAERIEADAWLAWAATLENYAG